MISEDKIRKNKEEFLSIANTIERDGIKELLDWLVITDFFKAPASTRFHNSFEGGLCEHSLNVYHNLIQLKNLYCPEISDESCKIVALFHDLAKVNFYEKTVQNKKVYSKNGSKSDEMGRFDWVASPGYKVYDYMDRDFVCNTHGVNSYLRLNKFMKLSMPEVSAIINHHSGLDETFSGAELSEVLDRYPLAPLLHMADYLATFITENPYMVDE